MKEPLSRFFDMAMLECDLKCYTEELVYETNRGGQAKPWLFQATKTEKPTSGPWVTPITQESDTISGKISEWMAQNA